MPGLVLPDANAFGIVAMRAERRGAAGAYPFVTALVTLLVFFEPLLQRLDQLVPAAQCLDLRLLFFREIALAHATQPFRGNVRHHQVEQLLRAFEIGSEYLVEAIEMSFVLH